MLEKLNCVISMCLPLIFELVKPILELVTTILEVDLTCDLPLILELVTPLFESVWMLIKSTSDSIYEVATSFCSQTKSLWVVKLKSKFVVKVKFKCFMSEVLRIKELRELDWMLQILWIIFLWRASTEMSIEIEKKSGLTPKAEVPTP